MLVTSTKNENYIPIIYATDKYVNLLSEKEYASAGLWHKSDIYIMDILIWT